MNIWRVPSLACRSMGQRICPKELVFSIEYVDDLYGGFKNSISYTVSMCSIC